MFGFRRLDVPGDDIGAVVRSYNLGDRAIILATTLVEIEHSGASRVYVEAARGHIAELRAILDSIDAAITAAATPAKSKRAQK